jgi:hypothetical protein
MMVPRVYSSRIDDNVTDEHIIPVWIKKMFPQLVKHFRYRGGRHEGGLLKRNLRVRRGNAFTAKVRKVCSDCNNGWMSNLEGRAKPILVPLFRGEQFTLEAEAQSILAGWIAKTTIAADTFYPESSATSPGDRTLVMTTRRAPENWKIWLARHSNAEWVAGLLHVGKAVHRAADYERLKNNMNTQSTTIGIWKLLIHAFSSAVWAASLSSMAAAPKENVLACASKEDYLASASYLVG